MSERDRSIARDFIITGLPRSGTTLATTLAHNPPFGIALHEPVNKERHSDDLNEVASRLIVEYEETRRKLYAGEAIRVRESLDGAPLTNYLTRATGNRQKNYREAQQSFANLPKDFALTTKHPALYTALLPEIMNLSRFKIVALVRNPIDTIISWRSVPFPIADGRLPGGERYWPALREIGLSNCSTLEKQVRIWELFANRFASVEDDISILKYETLCENPQSISTILSIPFRGAQISPPTRHEDDIPSGSHEMIRTFAPTAAKFYPAEYS